MLLLWAVNLSNWAPQDVESCLQSPRETCGCWVEGSVPSFIPYIPWYRLVKGGQWEVILDGQLVSRDSFFLPLPIKSFATYNLFLTFKFSSVFLLVLSTVENLRILENFRARKDLCHQIKASEFTLGKIEAQRGSNSLPKINQLVTARSRTHIYRLFAVFHIMSYYVSQLKISFTLLSFFLLKILRSVHFIHCLSWFALMIRGQH